MAKRLPYFSIFQNTKRIGPGEYINFEIKNNKVEKVSTDDYTNRYKTTDDDTLYERVIEIIEKLYVKNETSLMLSGGLDSTILGCAIEELGYRPRTYAHYYSASGENNPILANEVARKMNWEYKVVESKKTLLNGNDLEYIYKLMRDDYINPMNPHWISNPYKSKYVLSGQNADAIIGIDMGKRTLTDLKRNNFYDYQMYTRAFLKYNVYR